MVQVHAQRLTPDAKLPAVSQPGDVAADLFSAADATIPARGRKLVPTGIAVELPPGYRARIHSRSGLSLKHGIEAGAGLIDNQYRDAIGVVLFNHSDVDYTVTAGDRIAQICIERYDEPAFVEVDLVPPTGRTAGFGSSGR
jgi:dUTP pyrophosphatase